MFCYKCGKEITEGDKFCNNCGTIVGGEKKNGIWKWLGYAWTVILNLITIGVVLAIYGKMFSSFEMIVVSILILIYLSIQNFSAIYGRATIETALGLDAEFRQIRKLLKEDADENEAEELYKSKSKADKMLVKMYINIGFSFVIYLIAIFHIFSAL